MTEVGSLFVRLKADASEFEQTMNSVGGQFKNAGQSMQSVGSGLTKNVTAPLVGIAGAAIAVGMGFDAQMSKVQAISGATGEEFDILRDTALELGASTKFSATQAAQGLEFMALAGWDANEMASGLPGILSLAAAANLDLGKTSDIVTDTMSAFGMEAHRSSEAADIFARQQAQSNTSVDQLGEAMKMAAPAAHAAGMSLGETSAALGVLADSGIKGSMAGTTMNAILRDLIANAEDGSVMIGDTAVAVFDAEGNFRSFGDIMRDVDSATDGMNDSQRESALRSIFQAQSIRGVNLLLGDGINTYDKYAEANANAAGTADEMARIMGDNVAGGFTQLKSAMEGALIQLSDILAPILKDTIIPAMQGLIEKISGLISWFSNLSPTVQTVILVIAGIAAAIGPVLVILGTLGMMIGGMITGFGAIAGVLGLVLSPIGLIVIAIAALVAGFIIAYQTSETFRNIVNGAFNGILAVAQVVWPYIQSAISTAWDVIQTVIATVVPIILDTVSTAWETIKAVAETVWPIIQTVVSTVVEAVRSAVETAIPVVQTVIETVFNAVQSVAETVWPIIQSAVETASNAIDVVVNDVFPVVQEIVTTVFNAVRDLAEEHWPQIQEIIRTAAEIVRTVVEEAFTAIQTITETVWPFVRDTVETVADAVQTVVDKVWPHIQTVIETAMDAVQSVIETVLDVVQGVWERTHDSLESFAQQIWDSIKALIESTLDVIQGILETVMGLISGDWERAWEGIKQTLQGIWDGIEAIVDLGIASVQTLLDVGWAVVAEIFDEAWDGLKDAVSTGTDEVVGFMRELPDRILNALGDLSSLLYGIGRDILNGLIDGITSKIGDLTGKLSEVTNLIPDWKGPPEKDRKLLLPAGRMIMEGLDQGLQAGQGDIMRRLMGLTDSIGSFSVPGFDGAMARDGVAVTFNGPVEILATDRTEAERSVRDLGVGMHATLRARGQA